jgi:hypothetical protein
VVTEEMLAPARLLNHPRLTCRRKLCTLLSQEQIKDIIIIASNSRITTITFSSLFSSRSSAFRSRCSEIWSSCNVCKGVLLPRQYNARIQCLQRESAWPNDQLPRRIPPQTE